MSQVSVNCACTHNGSIGCSHGDIQLENSGAIQVCYSNVWKSICRNGAWSSEEVNVVCSQLGYSNQGTCFIEL